MKLSRIALAAPAALLLAGMALAAEDPAEGGIERMPPGAEAAAAAGPETGVGASPAARPDAAVPTGEAAPAAAAGDTSSSGGKEDDKERDKEGASAAPAPSDPEGEPARSRI